MTGWRDCAAGLGSANESTAAGGGRGRSLILGLEGMVEGGFVKR